jgi:predicted Fe-Mo cluster-binding NifX family protein
MKNNHLKNLIYILIALSLIIVILLKLSRDIIKNEIVNFLKSPSGSEILIQIINSKIEYLADRNFSEFEKNFLKNNLIKIKDKFKFLLDE